MSAKRADAEGIWQEPEWATIAGLGSKWSSPESCARTGWSTHVLIVEDETGLREWLQSTLKCEGFQVTAVETGKAALEAVQTEAVQIVLADFRLPDGDGISLLESLLDYDGRIIGIVITGYGTIDLAVKAMKVGAVDVLPKPFSSEQVLMALRRALKMQRLQYENGLLKQAVLKGTGVRLQGFRLQDIDQPAPDLAGRDGEQTSVDLWHLAYRRGLIEGERRAREATGVAQQQTLAAALGAQLGKIGSSLPQGLEEQVAALAFKIACKVVRDCAEEKRDLILAQAREALARVRESRSVEIRVNPRDLPVLEAAREALSELFEGPVTMKLEAEASISPGGCLVETPTRLIDATIEAQLIQLGEALRRRGRHEP